MSIRGREQTPLLSSDLLSLLSFLFGSIKLVVLAEGFLGPSLGTHFACVNGQDGGWLLPCMQMILVLPLSNSLLAPVSGSVLGVSCQDSVNAMRIKMDL